MDGSNLDPPTITPERNILRDIFTESATPTRTRFTIHSLPCNAVINNKTIKTRLLRPNFSTLFTRNQELRQIGDCRTRNCITPPALMGLRISPISPSPCSVLESFTPSGESEQQSYLDEELQEQGGTFCNDVSTFQSEPRPENFNHFGLPNAAGESTLSGSASEVQNTNFSKGELDEKFHFNLGKVLTDLNDAVTRNYGSNPSVHRYPGRRYRVVVRLRKRKHLSRCRSLRTRETPSPSPNSKAVLNVLEESSSDVFVKQSKNEVSGSNLRVPDPISKNPSAILTKVRKFQRSSVDSPMSKTTRHDKRTVHYPKPFHRRSKDLLRKVPKNPD